MIGCVRRYRNLADHQSFTRTDFNDVNGERSICTQVIVVSMAVALIEREHLQHGVNDLARSNWANNLEWNIDWHHHPTRCHKIIEVGDVIAM